MNFMFKIRIKMGSRHSACYYYQWYQIEHSKKCVALIFPELFETLVLPLELELRVQITYPANTVLNK